LLAQCILLSTWKEAAFILRFAPEKYTAVPLENAMKEALGPPHPDETPLDTFFIDVFVACLLVDSDLYYEPADRVLRWRDQQGASFIHRLPYGT
jgi:hypothetical protein